MAGAILFLISYFEKKPSIFLFPLITALISRFVFAQIIYFFWKRKRPFEVGKAKLLIPIPQNPAFPSAHASVFFSIAFILFSVDFYLAIIFLVIAVIVSLARIAVGAHWFSDVIGGFINGIISALVTYYLLNLLWI